MANDHISRTRIGIRLSNAEYDEIRWRATFAGVSLSEYVRRSATTDRNRPLIVADTALLRQIYVNLRRSGSNLNQISRALNKRNNCEWALDDLKLSLKSIELASGDVSSFITEIRNSI